MHYTGTCKNSGLFDSIESFQNGINFILHWCAFILHLVVVTTTLTNKRRLIMSNSSEQKPEKKSIEERAKDLIKWLEKRLIVMQIFLLALALFIHFVILVVSGFKINTEFAYGLIVTLLILLCFDFIIFSFGYLEKIKSNSCDILNPDKDPYKKANHDLETIKEAASSIFGSIGGLSQQSLDYLRQIKLDSGHILNSISIQNPDKLPGIEDALKAKECVFRACA